jgi:hypothetical protein
MIARVISRAEFARATVSGIFAKSVGCYQGDGDTLLAIDLRRTKGAWRQPLPQSGTMLIGKQLGDSNTSADELFNANRVETILNRYSSATDLVLPRWCERFSDWEGASSATGLLEQLQGAHKAGLFAFISSGNFEQSKRAVETLSREEARNIIRQALEFKAPDPQASIEARLLAWSALNMQQLVAVEDALNLLDKVMPDLERAVDTQLRNLGGGDIGVTLAGLQADLGAITKEVDS